MRKSYNESFCDSRNFPYDKMQERKYKKNRGLKAKVLTISMLLLALAVVGLSLGLAFGGANDTQSNKLRMTFMLGGEVYQTHYIRSGSQMTMPHVDSLMGGWALYGEFEIVPFCPCCTPRPTTDMKFWAPTPGEVLFEHEISSADFPTQIVITQHLFLIQRNLDGYLMTWADLTAGTLALTLHGNWISISLDGEHKGSLFGNPGMTTLLRGYTII